MANTDRKVLRVNHYVADFESYEGQDILDITDYIKEVKIDSGLVDGRIPLNMLRSVCRWDYSSQTGGPLTLSGEKLIKSVLSKHPIDNSNLEDVAIVTYSHGGGNDPIGLEMFFPGKIYRTDSDFGVYIPHVGRISKK